MRQIELEVTADANGAGNATFTFNGLIVNAYAVPEGGMTGNVDFTLVAPPKPGVAPRTLLSASNIGTSGVDYPLRIQAKDSTGTAITGVYVPAAVCGDVTFTIAQGTSGKKVTLYLIVDDSDGRDGRSSAA